MDVYEKVGIVYAIPLIFFPDNEQKKTLKYDVMISINQTDRVTRTSYNIARLDIGDYVIYECGEFRRLENLDGLEEIEDDEEIIECVDYPEEF